MTERPRKPRTKDSPAVQPTEPIDVVDGIADRQESPARWKYVLIALIFVVWVIFLLYCQQAGAPPR